ncbi:MAG: hypothetical protein ACYC1M_11215 [Armatimonadota bacterium]
MKRIIATALMLASLLAVAAPAITPAVKALPKGSVAGWKEMASAARYVTGNDLTELYDGGIGLYQEHGVLDAQQRIYQKGNDYLTATSHTMKSAKHAAGFVAYWKKSLGKMKSSPAAKPWNGFIMQQDGAVTVQASKGVVYLNISLPSDKKSAVADVQKVLKALK